jgi:hypothetical protein
MVPLLDETPTALFRYLRRMPLEGMNRHFRVTNIPMMFYRLDENAWRLRGLVVNLSNLILRNVADRR